MRRRRKRAEPKRIRYSKIIVAWAMSLVTILTLSAVILAWRAEQQLDAASVAALAAVLTGEFISAAFISITEKRVPEKKQKGEVTDDEN